MKENLMRVYGSKNVGHGIRVGVSQDVRPTGRRQRPVAPRVVAQRPVALRGLFLGTVAAVMAGFVFPPLLLVALVLFVATVTVQVRWNNLRRALAAEQCPPQPRRR